MWKEPIGQLLNVFFGAMSPVTSGRPRDVMALQAAMQRRAAQMRDGQLPNKSSDFILSDFSGQTWVEIGELEALGSVGDASAEVAFQGISSKRDRRLKGTRNAGAMDVVFGLDSGDAGQTALLAAERINTDYAFKLLLNDGLPLLASTVTMTIATPGVITWNGHGLANGRRVKFATTGALPTGLVAGTTYFVVSAAANTFQVAATLGGSAINTTGTQSGVHTCETVSGGSERYFVAAVGSAVEAFDTANNVMKLNSGLWVNSNIVKVAPS